jgi:imidazolonepropionase
MNPLVVTNCAAATMTACDAQTAAPYGLVENAAIAMSQGEINWAGPAAALPPPFAGWPREDLGARLVTPALIDCHTHLVYGGTRAREFEMRLSGASYAEISTAGGGIQSTVAATRAASDDTLIDQALARLDEMIAKGVGVVEIKSGYGLTIDDEIRLLRIARHLETLRPAKIKTTWLAAHAVPAGYGGGSDDYIDRVAIEGLKRAAAEGLVDAVDAFCETIAFTPQQVARVFECAQSLGLPVKLHAEQLSDQKGAVMATSYQALSCDHLEYLAPEDVDALARSQTVAVLLPGAFYTLGETKRPPIDALRAAGVRMAVATDCNPGSSPLTSLPLAMNMASTVFGLTPEEVLAGATRNAAAALALESDFGTLEAGKRAELVVWEAAHPSELAYRIGGPKVSGRITTMDAI